MFCAWSRYASFSTSLLPGRRCLNESATRFQAWQRDQRSTFYLTILPHIASQIERNADHANEFLCAQPQGVYHVVCQKLFKNFAAPGNAYPPRSQATQGSRFYPSPSSLSLTNPNLHDNNRFQDLQLLDTSDNDFRIKPPYSKSILQRTIDSHSVSAESNLPTMSCTSSVVMVKGGDSQEGIPCRKAGCPATV